MLHVCASRVALAGRARLSVLSLIGATLLVLGFSQPSQSQTYKVIHNFVATDGESPYSGPILDSAGNLYGTTYAGAFWGAGGVYRLSPSGSSWTLNRLYSFKAGLDGTGPGFGTLAVGPGPAIFGTTEGGGDFGVVYKIGPNPNCTGTHCWWQESIVHDFGTGTDGWEPIGGVVFDAAGNFYGTTLVGGASGNGIVYEVSPSGTSWNETVLYNFPTSGPDAINPVAALTLDAQGNLYGTAPAGGAYGFGAIFKLTRTGSTWKESVLYSFQGADDGQNPVGGLAIDKAGNLYGGTFLGGANGGGTVYELSPSGSTWNFQTLYSFSGYGGPYNKLTFDSAGSLYGITNSDGAYNDGTVFKLTPSSSGWTFTNLHDFAGGTDGASPYGQVAVDGSGNVFGTAAIGGTENYGVIFEITP